MDPHTRIILARYADGRNLRLGDIQPDVLVSRYLSKVMAPEEFAGKTILEIGAGCSLYVPVFLGHGCARYYANDLIPERLAAIRVDDPRYVELAGDFRHIEPPEPVDLVFATLTMMLVVPMLDQFVRKIATILKPGGMLVSMDANYFCPLSIFRLIRERTNNPVRLFNPFRYADIVRRNGLAVEALVPFTAPLPRLTGNWLLGTSFWLKARKT
ncbi:MAG: class I SAM-dependent methyltransferase [Bauldia sp.]